MGGVVASWLVTYLQIKQFWVYAMATDALFRSGALTQCFSPSKNINGTAQFNAGGNLVMD